MTSGAGTNLKVGGHWSGAKVGEGHRSNTKRRINFLRCPSTFLALQLVLLVSAFMMVSTVWSVSCLLFFESRCPPCLMESAPMVMIVYLSYGVGFKYVHGTRIAIFISFLSWATISALPCCPVHFAVCFKCVLNMLLAGQINE